MYGNTSSLDNHVNYTKKEWTTSRYYKSVLNFLIEKEIKTFVDIGSCTGILSDILFDKVKTVEYGVLVEANPNNFEFIKNRLQEIDNIDIVNKALFYGSESISIGSVGSNVGAWSYKSNINNIDIKTVNFEEIIETFFNSRGLPDFVKIDIEGAEYNFIENSDLLKHVPIIEIEFHNNDEYGVIEGNIRNDVWKPFINKFLPNHELILGGTKEFYDGSGLFILKENE